MPRPAEILSTIFTAITLSALPLAAAVEIHVSPKGDDANPGTPDRPLATPQAARDQLRQVISKGLTEPVNIIFAAGNYLPNSPLELLPADSGTENSPITWKAAPGAKVIWDGGLPIPNKWTKGENGMWQVDLTGIGPDRWDFRQLFVDGKRAARARFPNVDEKNPFLYATGGDLDHLVIDPKLVKESWGRARDAQLNVVPQWRFFNQWNTVTKVDTKTGRIDIADSERQAKIIPGNWFWIEGVREELDQAGEWFFDPQTRRLDYMPEPGVDPNQLNIVAPVLNRLVYAKGDVNAGTHVQHTHFDGIEFRHTTFTLGHIEARVHTDSVILFENTLDCSVRNCRFENIGGYALWLHLDSRRNKFDRNTVRHSGGGGVLMTGARLSYMDDTKIYTPGEAAAKVAPILNEVTRNTVEHCGKIRYYGGVHLDSRPFSMSMEPGNLISHNYFNDLSRNGVFAFRNQGGSVVEYNWIYNAVGGAIKPIWENQNLIIEDNRESKTRIVPPFEKDLGPEGKATNGIDLASNRLTGSVIHHTEQNHVTTRGKWTPQTAEGMWGLFRFNFLTGTAATPSEATYSLPIRENGNYQISLLYLPGKDRASNVPVTIEHADGKADLKWNMRKGSKHGFSVVIGTYRF